MTFHLSLPAAAFEESTEFLVRLLNAQIARRAGDYVNLDIGGCQLTLHDSPGASAPGDELHFGVNLSLDAFNALAEQVHDDPCVVTPPRIVDPGTAHERRKMYLRCPSGYLVEIKATAS